MCYIVARYFAYNKGKQSILIYKVFSDTFAQTMEINIMSINSIKDSEGLREAFGRLELVYQAKEGTTEADEIEILVTLIEAYENKHFPISAADPIDGIKFRMEQQGLTQKDLEPFIGSSGRVSEVLNHERGLSLPMVKRLHEGLNIPYESLLSAV